MTTPLMDIADGAADQPGRLSWVGMEGIDLPLTLAGRPVQARAHAGVSLDAAEARGIHMSRLYLALERLVDREITPGRLQEVLAHFLDSHHDLSREAFLDLEGEAMLRRPALVSPLAGWKAYPFALRGRLGPDGFALRLSLEIGYSSTCPCSAGLARQLIQERFDRDFEDETALDHEAVRRWLGSEQGIVATPHSQRSRAHLELRLDGGLEALPVVEVIERAEASLGTALQTAVKRVDEQAFALANGQNLMFCEDAARRLDRTLREQPGVAGFRLRVVHAESLHAHDAVARSQWNWPEVEG
ncbi:MULTISPECIES: GTP cyclohydrolase FolE2 [Halomonas]|uniref:GTP cyclohydrolase FolE2 n=1 Tax=Halomonas halophila TaxID=29573 RepID=A0ABQ0U1Z4_9GAMM|nr:MULTISPECIES: GTP cyclohydrolase FolE2 [Halomonas]MDR5889406.1 GTP cyclohydrolase FolE2 [Halomonas salina]WJY06092.1 GTP cyclohydrolase FolE2 [Halomonas halophila]GEK72405.1 GTP cyclohydrolase FolE2 [Halomonas halophila]